MLDMILTPRQLVRQVGSSVKCDLGSTMAGATRLIAGASNTTPYGGVRFPGEFFITASAFALGQVLHFGSLAYITVYYNELHSLNGLAPVHSEFLAPPPPPGSPGTDLGAPPH
jgi:hypothetical protein